VEIKDGVELGDDVVVEQSFLVKADIAKAGAEHEH
jgi:cobalt-zinc-cadmium efflux system membrane fusion protein